MNVGRMLIIAGIVLVAAGLLFVMLERVNVGKLPGDIVWKRGNATFYFPLMTSLLISVVLSLLLWLFSRR